MKRVLRWFAWSLLGLLALIALCGALFAYFIYSPARDLPKGAPLVLVMHGSGQSAEDIRVETGYGFAIAYPSSYSFDWNDCGKVGDYLVNHRNIDDVSFLDPLTG